MIRKSLILIAILIIFAVVLVGCFEKKAPDVVASSGDEESGDIQISFADDTKTYGNGTDIVIYKGNIYYIEYKNSDYAEEGLGARYWIDNNSNNQRYVNKIDSRGNIKNLFKVTGATSFSIFDDRFYLKGSNGYIYTVDMNGENSLNLIKGEFIGIDEEAHAVYYQKEDDPNSIYKLNTEDLSIKPKMAFNNPTTSGNYNFLAVKNGIIYYANFDNKKGELVLVEHDIENNTNKAVIKHNVGLMYDESIKDESTRDRVVYIHTVGDYACVAIGEPTGGTMGGYMQGKAYTINLNDKTISEIETDLLKASEGGPVFDSAFYNVVEGELYKLNFGGKFTPVEFATPLQKEDFAKRYKLNLEETLGDEGAQSLSMGIDTKKYDVEVEDYKITGDKIFYTITASRANPSHEIGWRPSYIRIASEVYLKDLTSGNEQLVYSYLNNDWENQLLESQKEYEEQKQEEEKVVIDEEKLSPNEMMLEIKVDNFWEKEFDIRVEEVGGTIFGKRVEYEGHHKKEDGTIKLKVSKEVGAMLTVYKNNELEYQFVIDSSM